MVVNFAYLTGMRAGEIFKLTWDKVDLANRVIQLERKIPKLPNRGLSFLAIQLMIF